MSSIAIMDNEKKRVQNDPFFLSYPDTLYSLWAKYLWEWASTTRSANVSVAGACCQTDHHNLIITYRTTKYAGLEHGVKMMVLSASRSARPSHLFLFFGVFVGGDKNEKQWKKGAREECPRNKHRHQAHGCPWMSMEGTLGLEECSSIHCGALKGPWSKEKSCLFRLRETIWLSVLSVCLSVRLNCLLVYLLFVCWIIQVPKLSRVGV